MSRRIISILLVIVAVVLGAAVTQAPATAKASAVPGDSSLLAAREAAWRDWFGAGPGLEKVLPPNFVAIYPNDSLPSYRQKTLDGSRASHASGRAMASLKFPKDVIQRHGNVAVLHSRYELVTRDAKGARETRTGWITETFFWDGARWMHPSWHMSDDTRR